MKITTWNVNGIRAALKKDIAVWIGEQKPDILCLQEVKAKLEQVELAPILDLGYAVIWNAAQRPGYSGVATFYQKDPVKITKGIGVDIFYVEGRVIETSYPNFELFNIYFPNGGQENERVPFKLDFYAALLDTCDKLHKEGKHVIIAGDFNTAHREIDLKNPKENEKNTGFLPEERVWIDHYLEHDLVDIFRQRYPDKVQYSWWTYRFKARERNIGWRLDYYLISSTLAEKIIDVTIHDEVLGSDHCPVTLEIKNSI
jgi:exodeoxyribonuclease-3